MKKTFCDLCGDEIKDEQYRDGPSAAYRPDMFVKAVGKSEKTITVRAEVIVNGSTGAYDVCNHCIIDAVNRMDDRPKAVAP